MKKTKPPRAKKPVQIDKRATEMLEQLTLTEKINQLSQQAGRAAESPGQVRGDLPNLAPGAVKLINK